MNVAEATTLEEQLVEVLADAHSIEEQALQQLAPQAEGHSRCGARTPVRGNERAPPASTWSRRSARPTRSSSAFDRAVESSPAAVVGS